MSAVTPRQAAASGILSVLPLNANFGSVPVGTANTQTFQLKNIGTSSLTLSSVTISGTGFSMSGVSAPSTLGVGASVNVTVKFAPTSAASYSGKITLLSGNPLLSSGSGSTMTIPLSGAGVSGTRTLSLSSTGLSFGNELLGATSVLDVTVKNTGNSSVLISQMTVSGTGFSCPTSLAGVTLAAGQSANLAIDFMPKLAGSATGQITLTSNATNSPSSIALTGTGVLTASHSVELSWTASSSSGVTGYNVYRSTALATTYTRINASPMSTTKYMDTSVTAGETYHYEVTAVTSSGEESPHSGEVTAVIP